MSRQTSAFTLLQATQASPTLAHLAELARDSAARLQAIHALIPAPLRSAVRAGPINGSVWCLLLDNNSTASKMRQLLPALEAHLRVKGWEGASIRLKVQAPSTR